MNHDDKQKSKLVEAVMDEVDERIHITRTKQMNNKKIVITDKEDELDLSGAGKKDAQKKPQNRLVETIDPSGKVIRLRRSQDEVEEELEIDMQEEQKPISKILLNIHDNHLAAYILVHRKDSGSYTRTEIMEFLEENGIVHGIKEDVIDRIVKGECYYEEVRIAQGSAPVCGQDGYYEFHFNTSPEMKPIILPDGSVDYNTLGKMELVVKDQLLATYVPARHRVDGMDIFGNVLQEVDGKDLGKLSGKGFDYDPEYNEYYANAEGKVTLEGSALNVVPVFTINGNLEAATGDVTFRGDVVVKGNVFSNITVKTTGNITIEGHVEIATLVAGKDILLKNGMQGAGLGRILAKGNVMAKFLEQTYVKALGSVSANAILNCTVEAGQAITVSGSRGAILGGAVSAVEQISAFTLGNRVGISTKLVLGLEEEFKYFMNQVEEKIEACSLEITDNAHSLERVIYQLGSNQNPELLAERNRLAEEKARLNSKMNELLNKRDNAADVRERSANGKIIITGIINPGTTIIMNGVSETLFSERRNVTITRSQTELRMLSNDLDMTKPRKGK